jgi:hypothetical protein
MVQGWLGYAYARDSGVPALLVGICSGVSAKRRRLRSSMIKLKFGMFGASGNTSFVLKSISQGSTI